MAGTTRSAAELLSDLAVRKASSVELTQSYLDQIARHDGKIKAFLLVDPAAALVPPRRSRRSLRAGQGNR
jgi:Asp-tRNA(Asn)/Glu-tRNA(Gln) amidotransferase A subunit family amidase